jgi:hypothetical protein
MQALTQMQRAFVMTKVHGGLDDVNAARAAGYTQAAKHAYRIARHPGVQDALLEEGRKLMRAQGPASILALVEIRDDKTVRPDTRVKAAVELLNRSGFHAVSEHHDHQHVHVSEAEQDRRILALCAELGMSPDQAQKMLIAPADMQRNAEGVYEITPVKPELSSEPNAVYLRETRARRKDMSPEEIEADKLRIARSNAWPLLKDCAPGSTRTSPASARTSLSSC